MKDKKGYCTGCNQWVVWIKHSKIGGVECPNCKGVAVTNYLPKWMQGS